MKQLFSELELVGKTIKKVFSHDSEMYLIFNDDTFVSFYGYDDVSVYLQTSEIDLVPNRYNLYLCVEFGLITNEQQSEIIRQYELEREDLIRKNDLETLKKLKDKYEK